MKRLRATQVAAAVGAAVALAATSTSALAQDPAATQNPLAGLGSLKKTTATVTVKSVDPATRHVVVTTAAGETFTLKAPQAMRNFDRLKVGDKITATYALETEFAISPPNGQLPPDTETTIAARAAKGEVPAAVVANHIVVTGAVLGINMANHTVKVVNPKGGEVHTISVSTAAGRKAMAKLKVGDYVTAYITEALLISTQPA
jgi:hypothetical protein